MMSFVFLSLKINDIILMWEQFLRDILIRQQKHYYAYHKYSRLVKKTGVDVLVTKKNDHRIKLDAAYSVPFCLEKIKYSRMYHLSFCTLNASTCSKRQKQETKTSGDDFKKAEIRVRKMHEFLLLVHFLLVGVAAATGYSPSLQFSHGRDITPIARRHVGHDVSGARGATDEENHNVRRYNARRRLKQDAKQ